VKAVPRMLGHVSASMTLDRYADLFDDDLDAVAGRGSRVSRTAPTATGLERQQWGYGGPFADPEATSGTSDTAPREELVLCGVATETSI